MWIVRTAVNEWRIFTPTYLYTRTPPLAASRTRCIMRTRSNSRIRRMLGAADAHTEPLLRNKTKTWGFQAQLAPPNSPRHVSRYSPLTLAKPTAISRQKPYANGPAQPSLSTTPKVTGQLKPIKQSCCCSSDKPLVLLESCLRSTSN